MNNIRIISIILSLFLILSCNKDDDVIIDDNNNQVEVNFTIGKAIYQPNETVIFTIDNSVPSTSIIRYRHLNETIQEIDYSNQTWTWQTPSADFKGYLVDIYNIENEQEVIYGAIAVDVSSDWKKFPRYGFLSKFPEMSESQMKTVIDNLNRYHINGLQFYDWTEKHHKPLAGTVANPSENWIDIASRPTYKSTVEGYINKAHKRGMKAMSYNLCYGALDDAFDDGVQEEWYMFDDPYHYNKTVLDIGSFFKSVIYLLDASNINWQQYLANKNSDMYSVFDFDGYHIDQLGDWGTKYTFNGQSINIANTYSSFIQAMKSNHPNKRLVMNAVNQYGQQGSIGNSEVDFLYTEVWHPNNYYADLANIIQNNYQYSGQTKNSVLAAYINYDLAENTGNFNTPSVLFADAVIFAFGGAHIELGEHMLGKEYFPNSNLEMHDELRKALISYYDFSVAYQNLLRDGGVFNNPILNSMDETVSLKNWPPQTGTISVIGKTVGSKQIVHLINFISNSSEWRDTNGTKSIPNTIENFEVSYTATQNVSKVWFASPDLNFGNAIELDFQIDGSQISFVVPSLKYWDMIMIE
ncbi:dextranase precursor [hydrothermal vent metagenome]|uniref:Dextranase n=1 Tax=hydrothermal vent metagenome TaxID=652676 RepID=A0A3B0U5Y0_9ZZZZ